MAVKWFISYMKNDNPDKINLDINKTDNYKIIPSDNNKFFADPFVIKKHGKNYIFFEECNIGFRNGVISYVEIDDNLNCSRPKIVLEKDYHLSYPFWIKSDDKLYMIPETYQNNQIEMYRCDEFPDKWVFDAVLIPNINAVDTTIYKHKGLYWLFTSIYNVNTRTHNDNLTIYYAEQLRGPWIKHPFNVSNNPKIRCSGKIFKRNGYLIRPSQESIEGIYGKRIIFNRIIKLDKEHYEEVEISAINPTWYSNLVGTHTFNFNNDLIVFDGCVKTKNILAITISDTRKFIFVDVPKTGGATVADILGQYSNKFLPQYKTSMFDEKVDVNDVKYESYFKFAFVRNPWDLAFSLFLSLFVRIKKGELTKANFRKFLNTYPPLFATDQTTYLSNLDLNFIGKYENFTNDLKYILKELNIDLTEIDLNKRNTYDLSLPDYRDYYDQKSKEIIAKKFAIDIKKFGYTFT